MKRREFESGVVGEAYDSYEPKVREQLLELRVLIFDVADRLDEVGGVQETLKWGEPSYIARWGKGSTIRLAPYNLDDKKYAMYFKCTSLLIPAFKKVYPDDFEYSGNRAIFFCADKKISVAQTKKLKNCIEMALTYHVIKDDLKEIV